MILSWIILNSPPPPTMDHGQGRAGWTTEGSQILLKLSRNPSASYTGSATSVLHTVVLLSRSTGSCNSRYPNKCWINMWINSLKHAWVSVRTQTALFQRILNCVSMQRTPNGNFFQMILGQMLSKILKQIQCNSHEKPLHPKVMYYPMNKLSCTDLLQ